MAQILYEDTRQQKGKHERKNIWWRSHGVTVQRRKVDFGDYVTDGSNISIDTKANLQEICGNLGKDHDRVVREIERARDAGYRLVFLIEVGGNYKSVEDVGRWTNDVCKRCEHYRAKVCQPPRDRCKRFRRAPMAGTTLAKVMKTMEQRYGCRFEFVHPMMAAKRVCDLLGIAYE